mmetsp:Transcript_11011/g.13968  ORF Transcript_11011/g.13968 Transcript_11011/m.13968 type:complete len:117 (+) Transcript_11011:1-351(+)
MDGDTIQRLKDQQCEMGNLAAKNAVGKERLENEKRPSSFKSSPSSGGRNKAEMSKQASSNLTSPLAETLRKEIDDLTIQVNNVYLSEAKKYAMKKKLAMQKAKLIKEERRIRTENA